jgi:hypothetical protein
VNGYPKPLSSRKTAQYQTIAMVAVESTGNTIPESTATVL